MSKILSLAAIGLLLLTGLGLVISHKVSISSEKVVKEFPKEEIIVPLPKYPVQLVPEPVITPEIPEVIVKKELIPPPTQKIESETPKLHVKSTKEVGIMDLFFGKKRLFDQLKERNGHEILKYDQKTAKMLLSKGKSIFVHGTAHKSCLQCNWEWDKIDKDRLMATLGSKNMAIMEADLESGGDMKEIQQLMKDNKIGGPPFYLVLYPDKPSKQFSLSYWPNTDELLKKIG